MEDTWAEMKSSLTLKLLFTIVILILVLYIQIWNKVQAIYKLTPSVPFPENLSTTHIIGHGRHFINNAEKKLQTLLQCCQGSESIYKIRILKDIYFILSCPEDYKTILSNNRLNRGSDFNLYQGLFLRNLHKFQGKESLEDESDWSLHNELYKKVLRSMNASQFINISYNKAKVMVEILHDSTGSTVVMNKYINNSSFDVICEFIFGVPTNFQKGYETMPSLDKPCEIAANTIFHFAFSIKEIFSFYKFNKNVNRYSRYMKALQKYFDSVLLAKLKIISDSETKDVSTDKTFAGVMLGMNRNIKGRELDNLREDLMMCLLLGFQSVSTALGFVLLMLAMHKEIQEKVFEEIIREIGYSESIDIDNLKNLKSLNNVINETIRLFPVSPIIMRKLIEDVQLEEHILPKGTEVVLMILSTHRSEKYFKDPMKFIPDRFCDEEIGNILPYSYLPFSDGPRSCIGKNLAMMHLKTQIVVLLRKFKLETSYKSVEQITLKYNIYTKPVDGFRIKLSLRDNNSSEVN